MTLIEKAINEEVQNLMRDSIYISDHADKIVEALHDQLKAVALHLSAMREKHFRDKKFVVTDHDSETTRKLVNWANEKGPHSLVIDGKTARLVPLVQKTEDFNELPSFAHKTTWDYLRDTEVFSPDEGDFDDFSSCIDNCYDHLCYLVDMWCYCHLVSHKMTQDGFGDFFANFERERASLTLWGSWRVTCFVSGLGGGGAAEGAGAM